ncbi:hypothetical protein C493_01195 [Natronolimnohabitans innermongolicus JCM 12255]|uniref:Uncharacterized protein n=1 Tax=Natronolimnohabitans innermongolicus JCM 12255 TaxID=1227499 RepID=L9XJR0_9EURY|nr:hypothetical protein C493_01195 [Natronolimnohabitans innermongolicus JCM 12255]
MSGSIADHRSARRTTSRPSSWTCTMYCRFAWIGSVTETAFDRSGATRRSSASESTWSYGRVPRFASE